MKNYLRQMVTLVAVASASVTLWAADSSTSALTLKKVMSDPDWIGSSPESPYWSDNAQAIFYSQKEKGHKTRRLMRVSSQGGTSEVVTNEELDTVDRARGVLSQDGIIKAYIHQGDVYIKNLTTGRVSALTLTHDRESQIQFLQDGRLSFLRGNSFYAVNLHTGAQVELAQIKMADAPKQWKEPKDFLGAQQRRMFDYVRSQQDEKNHAKNTRDKQKQASDFKIADTFYLDKNSKIQSLSLSPNGRFVFVATSDKKNGSGRQDNMPRFVTADGYVKNDNVRTLVGQRKPESEQFFILDLVSQTTHQLSIDELPGIKKDPLAKLKKQAAKKNGKKYQPLKGNRAVYIHNWFGNGVQWSDDGANLAVKLYSYDNKDRWLVAVDFDKFRFNTLHHLTDDAWVNDWTFNQMGWLKDNSSFYYLSEESGYSHLYLKKQGKKGRALTKGKFEVSDLTRSKSGDYIYYRANKKHPGIYEVYRVNLSNGKSEAVTDLGGNNTYVLSPDDQSLVITHSTTTQPPELMVQSVNGGKAILLTQTVTPEFQKIKWVKPQIIEVKSSHVDAPIYSRLYLPANFDPARAEKYPAVMFVHGAGYLQNSHQGWSGYFREFMFHTLLTQKGYVVLDMDYRASKGYGRDWRTAIYRHMGQPELEDLLDGKQWLLKNANVDQKKVGVYGGSYGGFMAFMAMFKAPGEFAAGAALRPVTDWSSYNHGYTSNILNTPEVDPEAYNRSSPIEFAEGLSGPLLIAHGMVDDNVFFKDSVRLVQKLIELEKTPLFETAIYPIEPHGFTEPSSWLDEYTRIYLLFEKHVK